MRVAVVGAGIAGLAVAHFLKREAARRSAPIDLTIYEGSPRPGGRIRTLRDAGYQIECAANGIQGGDGAAARLVEDLGLSTDRMNAAPNAARRYVAIHGALHLVPNSLPTILGFRPISLGARLRILAEPILARRGNREETVADFASRHIGKKAARVLMGPAARGIFAGDADKLSLDAAFPTIREMERKHRSLFLAMIRGRRDPSARLFWSLRGGMGQLTEALATEAGVALRLSAPALAIERAGDGPRSPWRIHLASGERTEADSVVIAAPPKAAAALLRQLHPELAKRVASIEVTGVAVAALAFRPQAFRSIPDGFGFLVAPGEDLEILGAVYESNLYPGRAPDERILVRAMLGGVDRPDLLARSDADLVALAMKALDRTLGLASGPERTWVLRQEESIPQYGMGHRALVGAIASDLDGLPGIHLTGNAYRGVSVGNLIEDAERVAARALS
jgi:oxygen-dependent protoporphyrinogen oxidase